MPAEWPRRPRRLLAALAGLAVVSACAGTTQLPPAPAVTDDAPRTILLVRTGWHTGIVLPRDDALAGGIAEAGDFAPGTWLEFGWGDRDYFTAPNPGLLDALVAGLVPTNSAMHVVARSALPRSRDGDVDTVAVPLSEAGYARLMGEIAAAFDRGGGTAAAPLPRRGQQGVFYPAHGAFHLFNTCNTWIARRLAAAGVPLSPTGIATADTLMARVRAALRRVQGVSESKVMPIFAISSSTPGPNFDASIAPVSGG
jgi:uncharacterized protein (TIGR02117 family)